MQKVLLTLDNSQNAELFLQLIKQFDFVKSVKTDEIKPIVNHSEDEIFEQELPDNFFLEDMKMTVEEFRNQTLQDETEKGMTKADFFKSIEEWRKEK